MKIPQRMVKIAGINREVVRGTESVMRGSLEGLVIAVQNANSEAFVLEIVILSSSV